MGTSLIRGKYVICKVTGPNSSVVVKDGAVFQRDGEIVEVGPYEELKARHTVDEVLGSSSFVVMPGLVNDHFHVGLSPFQLGAPDLPLELWSLYRMRGKDVDPYLDQLYGAVLMIRSGTTTVQAIHSRPRGLGPFDLDVSRRVLSAYEESGMRVSYAPSLVNKDALVVGPKGGEEDFIFQLPEDLRERFGSLMRRSYYPAEEVLQSVEQLHAEFAERPHERIQITVAPSNVHRCSDDLLVGLRELGTKYGTGIHIHLQETVYQKQYGLRAWGKTPLQHLNDLEFLGPDVVCGHAVWVTDEDIDLFDVKGITVCHNASSNLRLQSGVAPINKLLQRGIRVALGTDESGLNDDKDMLQEMRLALKIHRVPGVENTPPTAHQILQMATVNGAYASGFGDRIGTLEEGKLADMVLLSLNNVEDAYLEPDVSIVDAVLHRGRSVDIDTVIVHGEVIMRGHKLTRVDEQGLYEEIRGVMARPRLPHELERKEVAEMVEPHLRLFLEGSIEPQPPPHYFYNARVDN